MATKKRKMKKPRCLIALYAILHCKGGPMRSKKDRRGKEKKAKLDRGEID